MADEEESDEAIALRKQQWLEKQRAQHKQNMEQRRRSMHPGHSAPCVKCSDIHSLTQANGSSSATR